MRVRGGIGRAALMLVLALAALVPAACGKKGSPKLPDGQTDNFPQQYPKSTDPQTGIFN